MPYMCACMRVFNMSVKTFVLILKNNMPAVADYSTITNVF